METVTFERSAVTVESRMKGIVRTFEQAASGAATFDRSMVTASTSANKLSASTDRAQASVARQAAAEEKAAAAAQRHSAAETRVAEVMASVAGESAKLQAATLRQVAAQERLSTVQASGTATTRELAAAQAGLVSASRSVAAAQTTMATKAAAAGSVISKRFTLPVVAAAAVSVDQAVKFQKATNVYVTAAGESQKNLATVQSGIKGVATETGTSIDQLTAAEYLLEKAGLRGADGIKLLDAAAKGASEENANLADVVQGATSVMASYHIGTEKSVQVINALKTGAGQAKVTMEEYVKSLSTVIPIASAAGISIGQVLGAVSTLTQHGTTAAEATQELANTVRNLQAPNNVAVAAMNQLGISSVNVSKNLGKRGLTGTFDYIAAQLPKTGLVYLSAMKQMEAGTADLTTMQSKMSPQLAKLSDGFLKGTVNAADYRKAFRAMGADGYSQGSQFLSLAGKVKGYNDSLRNGTPAQKTMAAELKAIYGGATGLNTVLQLGGKNLAGFQDRTKAVNASLHDGSKDVEGWASTAKLASTQAGIAKEKLHVLAIDAGGYLLPVFNKLVGGVSKVVTWIGNLSHTDKEILGWSIGIVAALGPILSIGGRLATVSRGMGNFVGGVSTRLATLAGASESTALRVSTAMRGLTAALAGVGIGLVVGNLTKGASTTTKILGSLGAAGAGAAIGFSMGGPLGAAIGGLGAGLTSLATSFLGTGDSAKKGGDVAAAALAAQKSEADDLLSSLQGVNGAYDTQYRKTVTSKLDSSGALGIADKAGVNLPKLVDTVIGKGGPKAVADMSAQLENAAAAGKITFPQLKKVQDVLQTMAPAATAAEKRLELQNKALAYTDLTATQLGTSYKKLKSVLAATGTSLDTQTAAGLRNNSVIQQEVGGLNKAAASQLKHGKSVRSVATAYEGQITTLRANLTQMGFQGPAIDAIIKKYGKIPASVATNLIKRGVLPPDIQKIADKYKLIPASKSTTVKAITKPATSQITSLEQQIKNLKQNKVPGIDVNTAAGHTRLSILQTQLDALQSKHLQVTIDTYNHTHTIKANFAGSGAGGLPEGWSSINERGSELLYKSGNRVDVIPHAKSKQIIAATGMNVPGFAGGTGNEAKIAAGLSSGLGVGRNQIAGILGNLKIESGFNPLAYNAGENAWGIAQWEGSRLTALKAYADKHHESFKSLNAQIGYLVQELRGSSVLKQIKGMSNPAAIAAQVDAQFERSSGSTRGARMSAATSIAGQLKSGGLSSTGGGVGEITTTTVGGKKKWVYGGIQYASESAAENAQTRDSSSSAKDRAEAAKTKVSAAIGHIGQAGAGNPIDLSTVSYTRVAAQIKAAVATLHKEIGAGLSKGAEKSARAQIANLRKDANKALSDLRVHIRTTDVNAIRTALKGTASDLRAAFSTLLTDATRTGAQPGVITLLKSAETRLLAGQKALTSATTTLAAMKDYRSGIQSTLTGSFDSTGFGSIGDMQAGFSGATGTNKAYTAELTKLRGEAAHLGKGGTTDKTLLAYINQLAASGQTTTLQTLASSSLAGLRTTSASVGAYNASVTGAGDAAVVLKYGKSQATEQAQVTSLTASNTALANSVGSLAANLGRFAAAKQHITLKINGKNVTTAVVSNPAFEKYIAGVIHSLESHHKYGSK